MKLRSLMLTTALTLTPAMALAATPTPPTCTTTPALVDAAVSRCLNFTGGTNVNDQRNCFDAQQAVDTLMACNQATLGFLINNPTITPAPKNGGTAGAGGEYPLDAPSGTDSDQYGWNGAVSIQPDTLDYPIGPVGPTDVYNFDGACYWAHGEGLENAAARVSCLAAVRADNTMSQANHARLVWLRNHPQQNP